MELFEEKLKQYQTLFSLQNWVIESVVDKELKQNASTSADPRYCRATITISPMIFDKAQEWDRIIVHELIHVITSSYDFLVKNYVEDEAKADVLCFQRESSCSQLTEVILRALNTTIA